VIGNALFVVISGSAWGTVLANFGTRNEIGTPPRIMPPIATHAPNEKAKSLKTRK